MTGGRSPKNKGDRYERAVVAHLKKRGLHVEKAKRGNPTGDILGIPGVTIECKDQAKMCLPAWLAQAQEEKQAAGAACALVVVKRARVADVGKHYVVLTVDDALQLLEEAGYVTTEVD